jgi:hypothetical protein
MTKHQISQKLTQIARAARVQDHEAAHTYEDQLMAEVLQAIAKGAPDPVGLANEALKVKRASFPKFARWCA